MSNSQAPGCLQNAVVDVLALTRGNSVATYNAGRLGRQISTAGDLSAGYGAKRDGGVLAVAGVPLVGKRLATGHGPRRRPAD
jgi:hypothetical protein